MEGILPSVSFIARTPTNPSSDDQSADINQYFFVDGTQYNASKLRFCNEDWLQETTENDHNIGQSQAGPLTKNQRSFSTLEGKNLALIINNFNFEEEGKHLEGAYNDTSNLSNALFSRRWQVDIKK